MQIPTYVICGNHTKGVMCVLILIEDARVDGVFISQRPCTDTGTAHVLASRNFGCGVKGECCVKAVGVEASPNLKLPDLSRHGSIEILCYILGVLGLISTGILEGDASVWQLTFRLDIAFNCELLTLSFYVCLGPNQVCDQSRSRYHDVRRVCVSFLIQRSRSQLKCLHTGTSAYSLRFVQQSE